MAGVNWGGIANSGFDAFGNFQGGWEVGSIPLHTSLQPLNCSPLSEHTRRSPCDWQTSSVR